MEEHVQAAQRGAQEAGGGHANLGVARYHRDVGHQRHLETAPQRVAADLADGDLRKAHQVVVEAERAAVDGEAATLAGPALGRRLLALLAVPAVGVVHVGSGTEHAVGTSEQHHDDVIIVGRPVQEAGDRIPHGGIIGVAPARVVQRDGGDPPVGVDVEEHPVVGAIAHRCVSLPGRRRPNRLALTCSGGIAAVETSPVHSSSPP